MTENTHNTNAIEEEVSNIAIELYDTISLFHENDDLEAVHNYLESYIKRVTRIGFRVGKSEFKALRDFCVIFHDILEELNKQKDKLTEAQFQQFEVWPTLILAYINEPSNITNINFLMDFIEDPIWNYQPGKGELEELKEGFLNINTHNDVPETSDSTTSSPPSSIDSDVSNIVSNENDEEMKTNPFDGALFESVQEEIIEAMTGLISDLSSTDPDDDFGLNHAFNLCADRIELLGMSIATAGLMGLMDVCMIFQNGLRNLAKREKTLTDDEQIIIEEWTSHLIAYLTYPTDHDVVDNLVTYLGEIPWSDPLSDDELSTLRFMLIPEDIEVTAPVDDENDSYSQDIEPALSKTQSVHEEELVYEMDNTEGLDEITIADEDDYIGHELIQLIRDEFQLEQPSLDDATKYLEPNASLSDENIENLTKFKLMIERFSLATESIGLTGLNKILVYLVENLTHITSTDEKLILSGAIVTTLKEHPSAALNYLSDMDDKKLINELIAPFYSSEWPTKLIYEKNELAKELLSPKLLIEDDIEIRATQATIDDISLKLPEDVNQELLNTLLQELPIQTAEFTQSISQIVEGNASLKDVEKAQRIAHTLKGAANTVGIVGIATLTHHIEDIFNAFTDLQRLPSKGLADILMNAADVLEMMSEALLGLGDEPEQAQSVLQQILDWANLIDQEGIPEDDAQIQLSESTSSSQDDSDNSHLNDIAAPTMLRVPAPLMDELLRIAGESIILGGQLQERLRKATEQTQLVHEQNLLYQQLVFDLEQVVDVQGLSAKKTDSKQNEIFDSLELEQYNELHTITHRLVEAATDSKELTHNIEDELNILDTLLVDQSRLHKQNQNIVMQTRMIPVQNIVPRLQRSVRQTSRTTSKKVTLNVKGTDTLMDSDVLDDLLDPLMHILRNAVDHGIENEASRIAKGKDASGTIDLSFYRDGDHIVVRCQDDGSGLDLNAIRNTAIKKEIIQSNDEVSDEDLIRLIWLAGFTTRESTTQVSGRGIGMDAVYNQVTAMKGTINITSQKNIGCIVELKLPVTLISVHAILVKLRKQTIAISNRGIEQILCTGDGELVRDNENYTYHLNDEVIPAYDIETLLHQPREQSKTKEEERTVFILRDETGLQYAVSVEHVIANQDLIVKQLGAYIPDIIGIEGATILGDGSIAPVLDLPGLIRTSTAKYINPLIEQQLLEPENVEENLVALVVDDSLSARRSLAEFVKDIGYDVLMARDGIEALEVIEGQKPDIILVDLEMPRMNGLELTSHIRSKTETKDIPVIMITSRSTEKHREMADSAGVNAYLTKPFSEDELLENIQNLLLVLN